MNTKPIIIISGEPYSVFLEIFFKIYKTKLYKSLKNPVILVGSKKLVEMQMKKLNFSFKIQLIKKNNLKHNKIKNKKINLIDVKFNCKKPFEKI